MVRTTFRQFRPDTVPVPDQSPRQNHIDDLSSSEEESDSRDFAHNGDDINQQIEEEVTIGIDYVDVPRIEDDVNDVEIETLSEIAYYYKIATNGEKRAYKGIASSDVMLHFKALKYRLLLSQDEDTAEAARELWNYSKQNFISYFHCNQCGKQATHFRKCSSCEITDISTFVRVGVFSQITELVRSFLPEILAIRSDLKSGKHIKHILNSQFFSPNWKSEGEKHLNLSLVVSIDGVCISGNTNKLWPVSLILVDLPTGQMQKSSNIILEGLVEGKKAPSTALWNSIIPFVFSDAETHVGKCGEYTFSCKIMTCSVDQPAKRAFFGMKGHNAQESCLYCLSLGTYYKLYSYKRRDVRPGELTILDSELGQNGFNTVPATVVRRILPYESPIDLLHNLGEGLCEKILKEVSSEDVLPISDIFAIDKSDLEEEVNNIFLHSEFKNISQLRNGTDKTSYFRIVLTLVALECQKLTPKARVIIVEIGMLANKLYTDSDGCFTFDTQMTMSAQWLLSKTDKRYVTTKVHEILYHLPDINSLYGNVGTLSTASFESFYQFALCGYSSSTTRCFAQNACTKLLLHKAIRREIADRAISNSSTTLQKFISMTPDIAAGKISWSDKVSSVSTEDSSLCDSSYVLYSTMCLPCGKFVSEYGNADTLNDMMFATVDNKKTCVRFCAVAVKNGNSRILAEIVTAVPIDDQFAQFRTVLSDLNQNNLYYASEVLRLLKCYDGIICGNLSGKRVLLPLSCVKGVACFCHSLNYTIFLQANGAYLHN